MAEQKEDKSRPALAGLLALMALAGSLVVYQEISLKNSPGPDVKTAATGPKASDLINDDSNRTDLGDFQMVVITILAVIIYAISVAEFMGHIEFRRWSPCRMWTLPCFPYSAWAKQPIGQKVAGER